MERYDAFDKRTEQPPVLYLEYGVYGRNVTVAVSSSQYLWEFNNEEGTQTQLIGDSFFHPLAIVSLLPRVEIPRNLYKMRLRFSLPPDKYSVRYWSDRYAGNNEAVTKYYKEMKILWNSIVIPEDEKGLIVQVYGVWQQGEAYYSFYAVKQGSDSKLRPREADCDNG